MINNIRNKSTLSAVIRVVLDDKRYKSTISISVLKFKTSVTLKVHHTVRQRQPQHFFFAATSGLYWIQCECSHCCNCSNGATGKKGWNPFCASAATASAVAADAQ